MCAPPDMSARRRGRGSRDGRGLQRLLRNRGDVAAPEPTTARRGRPAGRIGGDAVDLRPEEAGDASTFGVVDVDVLAALVRRADHYQRLVVQQRGRLRVVERTADHCAVPGHEQLVVQLAETGPALGYEHL